MRIAFGPFTLDTDTRQLRRGAEERHLTPKAFDLLELLTRERPRALPKSTLLETLWPDTFVVEANLSNLVAELRAALDDDARQPRYVRTVYGRGTRSARNRSTRRVPRPPGLRPQPRFVWWWTDDPVLSTAARTSSDERSRPRSGSIPTASRGATPSSASPTGRRRWRTSTARTAPGCMASASVNPRRSPTATRSAWAP